MDDIKLILKAMRYAKKLVGVKYKVNKVAPTKDGAPFWASNDPPPNLEDIKKKGGMCCVGLPNLIRRYLGLQVPGYVTGQKKHVFPGGTRAWFEYLKLKKRLKKIDYNKSYPKGTLLLEDYNPVNMGHLAIVWTENKKGLLNSKILHSNYHAGIKSLVIEYFHNFMIKEKNNKRFTHICLPEDWLLKN